MHLPSWTLLNTQPHHSPTSTLSTPWPNWVSLWTPFFSSLSPYTHKCMITHCSMFNLPGLPPWRKLTLLFQHLSTPETPQLGLNVLWPPSPVSLRFWVCFETLSEEVGDGVIFIGSCVQHLGCVPLLSTHFLGYLSPLCERSTASLKTQQWFRTAEWFL